MYSDKIQVRQVVAALRAHGIRRAVLCAGSRNAPLNHSVASCPDFSCHPGIDERSACFEALGMAQVTGEPVAVCVTSGSALLNAAPAVCEAFYQEVPLVLVSADRPGAWIEQRDGQTMRQFGALAACVRHQISVPETGDAAHAERMLNEALLACRDPVPGPVHINLPLEEPLFSFTAPQLPHIRLIHRENKYRLSLSDDTLQELAKARKILLVAGQMPPDGAMPALVRTCAEKGLVVAAEHLSNLTAAPDSHPGVISLADLILATADDSARTALAPDLVITVGGHIVSKRLKAFLRSLPSLCHWHTGAGPELPDLFRCLTRHVQTNARDFLHLLAGLSDLGAHSDPAFLSAWTGAHTRLAGLVNGPLPFMCAGFSDITVMAALIHSLPEGCGLHLANSTPVRNAQYFKLPPGTCVFCNRGVNGIEGTLSTALGNARVLDAPVYCCIGDLSFHYDKNALWRDDLPHNLRIVLFNNGGGSIFRSLPGLDSPFRDRFIAGHNTMDARALSHDAGLEYMAAHNLNDLEAGLHNLHRARGPALLEVFTDSDLCASGVKTLIRALAKSCHS